jgi:hypothetical protein
MALRAAGVNSNPKGPSGPERDSKKIFSPATTGGRPISAFITTITPSRAKTRERDERAKRYTDQGCEKDRGHADDQEEPHDGDKRRIGGEHKLKGRMFAGHEIRFSLPVDRSEALATDAAKILSERANLDVSSCAATSTVFMEQTVAANSKWFHARLPIALGYGCREPP